LNAPTKKKHGKVQAPREEEGGRNWRDKLEKAATVRECEKKKCSGPSASRPRDVDKDESNSPYIKKKEFAYGESPLERKEKTIISTATRERRRGRKREGDSDQKNCVPRRKSNPIYSATAAGRKGRRELPYLIFGERRERCSANLLQGGKSLAPPRGG